MGIGDPAGKHAAGSEREMAELQLGAARTTCEDAFIGSPRLAEHPDDRASTKAANLPNGNSRRSIVPERLRASSVGGFVTVEVSNLLILLKHLLELSKTLDIQID
jgi:hypothetical protein